jgi:cyclopropane fatty-acyl-phospholipid synthase-like methyltransferase
MLHSMDSTNVEFWDSRYAAGRMPWDCWGVPAKVRAFLATTQPAGTVLIPGCGSGYEVQAFIENGCDVCALDSSTTAVARARKLLGPLADRVVHADFFAHDFHGRQFDLVYERTFLCSLPPERWPDYAARITALLRPGGWLVGFFLYGEEDDPPPYPLTANAAAKLFGEHFRRIADEPVSDSLPLFAGRERWQVWVPNR